MCNTTTGAENGYKATMQASQKFKSSLHCLPSPNGRLVATLLATGIHVRAVDRVDEVVCVVALPAGMTLGAVAAFQWSPSSRRILVASAEQILVAAVDGEQDPPFRALVRNATVSAVGKPALVSFGADDDLVCLCSALGIKFAVYSLQTGKTVEIANPKLYSTAAVCRRGFAFRPATRHLALLTRTAGKDWVSVHDPTSIAVRASWAPDTIDAQGLLWSPDGRWLVVWESPAHGHKLLFYTPEGDLFKVWTGGFVGDGDRDNNSETALGGEPSREASAGSTLASSDEALGSGVRLAHYSPDARRLAVGDASRCVRVLDMESTIGMQKLVHPTTLVPNAHPQCKIWQEQIHSSTHNGPAGPASHSFVEAPQAVSPPGRSPPASADAATGCSLLSFDCSSTYLVARLDEAPSTVWVWSAPSFQLCAVLMFHANVASAVWHSTRPRMLLIACEGDAHRGLGFVWHGPSTPPAAVAFSGLLGANGGQPAPGPIGKSVLSWLNLETCPPCLFYSNGEEAALVAMLDHEGDAAGIPWQATKQNTGGGEKGWAEGLESPLELVPAAGIDLDDDSEVEDTFLYKRDD